MKYEAEVDGEVLRIEIEEKDSILEARVGGRAYELELVRPEEGIFSFLNHDRVYEARVFDFGRDSLRVEIKGRQFSTKIIDRKHRRAFADHSAEGRQVLTAPMPGKVVRILAGVGDEVKAGQGIVVVEAMKMQNEVKSPKAGRVSEVRVKEGAAVDANQVLAIVE